MQYNPGTIHIEPVAVEHLSYGEKRWVSNERSDWSAWLGNHDDVESRLSDFNARLYDPDIGMFLAVDELWAEQPGWNPYHYAMNNPIMYEDRSGYAPNKKTSKITSKVIETTGEIFNAYQGVLQVEAGALFGAATAPTGIGLAGSGLVMLDGFIRFGMTPVKIVGIWTEDKRFTSLPNDGLELLGVGIDYTFDFEDDENQIGPTQNTLNYISDYISWGSSVKKTLNNPTVRNYIELGVEAVINNYEDTENEKNNLTRNP